MIYILSCTQHNLLKVVRQTLKQDKNQRHLASLLLPLKIGCHVSPQGLESVGSPFGSYQQHRHSPDFPPKCSGVETAKCLLVFNSNLTLETDSAIRHGKQF